MAYFAVNYDYDTAQSDTITEVRPVHREFLASLKDQGVIIASGPLEGDGALLLVEAANGASAAAALDKDPFFEAGVILKRTIRAWNPVIRSF